MTKDAERNKQDHVLAFESYGVKISLESPNGSLLDEIYSFISAFFPGGVRSIDSEPVSHHVYFKYSRGAFQIETELGKTEIDDAGKFRRYLRSVVRVLVARNATDHLFLHAGAVALGDKGIVFPGDSHSGKTSLVRELVRQGAVYFSDEYAVLHKSGMLLPFPKSLSVRGIEGPEIQTDIAIDELGGMVGTSPARIGTAVLTRYEMGARWRPVELSAGEGVLRLVPHAIGFVERPQFCLPLLEKSFKNAVFLESPRGDVRRFVGKFLETLDK